ncbi:hypothetical protein AGMMS4956_04840 [Bacteroidia bacterium]|nr:hypothetical protein AGMMS4956_04840 [Bacteroidia bacterium]
MKNLLKSFVVALAFVGVSGSASAQFDPNIFADEGESLFFLEFFGHGAAGLSTTIYDGNTGKVGGNFGLGAIYNFSEHFAVQTGVELASYFSQVKSIDYFDNTYTYPSEAYSRFPSVPELSGKQPADVTYTTDLKGYTEKQSAFYLNVPIMARYMGILKLVSQATSAAGYAGTYTSTHKMFVSAGVKIGIPITANVKQAAGSLVMDGVSELTQNKWSDFSNLEVAHEYGFGDRTRDITGNRPLTMKLGVTASLEAGYEFPLTESWLLYGGVYFDYGLVNVLDKSANRLIKPNDSTAPTIASYATTSDKVTNMGVGVLIRASFAHLFRYNKYNNKSVDIDFDTSSILGR